MQKLEDAPRIEFENIHRGYDNLRPTEPDATRLAAWAAGDTGIHWPQVQMQSGTTGTNTIRIYNPVKQGVDQDPAGVFTRRRVPELAPIAREFLHEPWKAPNAVAVLDKVYPFPIVDHLSAAKSARERVWAVRKGPAFQAEASAIQAKHGSRKSGILNRGQRPEPKREAKQMSLDL